MEKEIVTLKECMLNLRDYPFKSFINSYPDYLVINQSNRCSASVERYREERKKLEREENSIRRAIKKVEAIRYSNESKMKYKILDLFGLSNVSSNCCLVELRLRHRLQSNLRKGLRITSLILHNVRESLKLLSPRNYSVNKRKK